MKTIKNRLQRTRLVGMWCVAYDGWHTKWPEFARNILVLRVPYGLFSLLFLPKLHANVWTGSVNNITKIDFLYNDLLSSRYWTNIHLMYLIKWEENGQDADLIQWWNRFHDASFSTRTNFPMRFNMSWLLWKQHASIKVANFTDLFNLHDSMVCTTLFKLDRLSFNYDFKKIFLHSKPK